MLRVAFLGVLWHLAGATDSLIDPVDFVNIQGGTDSKQDFSHGGSLPLITRPWAFCNWAPLTESGSNWWFAPTSRKFYGMRITHQPSPWIADYGNFVIKANIPQSAVDNDYGDYIGYSPYKSTFSPHYFQTTFMTGGTMTEQSTMEFTATRHGGMMKLQFPSYVDDAADAGFYQGRRISVILNGGSDTATISNTLLPDGTTTISGHTVHASGSVPSNFAYYFVVAIYAGPLGNKPTVASLTHADSSVAYADFNPEDELNTNLVVRVGTSLISLEQAIVALNAEVSGRSFASLVSEAKAEWNTVLARAKLEDVGLGYTPQEVKDKYTTFYSTMYRMALYPRQLTEIDAAGAELHYSPYDGQVHSGAYSTDSGFWDAYSTVYPLLSLINRPQLATTLNGWLNAYKEGGWLPTWSSPANRGSMVGTMGDITFADAIVKEIPGFDVDVAYEAIRKDAFESQPTGVSDVGRACLDSYIELGYVPSTRCSEAVSRTLNYLQSDWAIARAAEKLGKSEDSVALDARAAKYDLLFENTTLFFRGRSNDTLKFFANFDQFAWGGDYTEGGPYQYKYYLPYNPSGLADLYAAAGVDMCEDLQQTQTMTSAFHIGGYSSEIHEMTEMTENCWGQYAHNNQPSHYMLYMFGAIDKDGFAGSCAARGQYWLRKATSTLYKPGADMFPGDEDNGQMAAWYLLSSMGLYSLSPGSTVYNFGSPLFARVSVNIGDADTPRTLTIVANNNNAANVYIQSISWNGVAIPAGVNSIEYAELIKGGELVFEMGPSPAAGRTAQKKQVK